jgi:hypothetical protein
MARSVWLSKNYISSMSTEKVSRSPGLTGVLAATRATPSPDFTAVLIMHDRGTADSPAPGTAPPASPSQAIRNEQPH